MCHAPGVRHMKDAVLGSNGTIPLVVNNPPHVPYPGGAAHAGGVQHMLGKSECTATNHPHQPHTAQLSHLGNAS